MDSEVFDTLNAQIEEVDSTGYLVAMYLRARLWRIAFHGGKPLFICDATWLNDSLLSANGLPNGLKRFQLITWDSVVSEATSLTFTQKCYNTLENAYDVWRKSPWSVTLFEKLDAEDVDKSLGFFYGADAPTADLILEWMGDSYASVSIGNNEDRNAYYVLPKFFSTGVTLVEEIKAGRSSQMKKGFFIRKYDEKLDIFFDPIEKAVSEATKCQIFPVWKDQKNGKIDELILRRIRESSVIIADATSERFNVGLEIGYALALRKQLVLIRDKADKSPLPFDIRTVNCFFYDHGDEDGLIRVLTERVRDGLEEARLGTHQPMV